MSKSTVWPHKAPVPCRRLRRAKGTGNLLRIRMITLQWMREYGVEVEPMPRTPKPCTHVHCVWIKEEQRYDCEVYA